MRKAARPLEDDGITVIPVAIGDDADANELENLAPDVLQPPDGTEPDELAKMIMKEIYTGKRLKVVVRFTKRVDESRNITVTRLKIVQTCYHCFFSRRGFRELNGSEKPVFNLESYFSEKLIF